MGKLKERAEAEVEQDRQEETERRERRRQGDLERHKEKAAPAAKWLSDWTGEEVKPEDLRDEALKRYGFKEKHHWRITIDGFDLELTDTGHPPNSDTTRKFELFQIVQHEGQPERRRVERPADLLGPLPVSAD